MTGLKLPQIQLQKRLSPQLKSPLFLCFALTGGAFIIFVLSYFSLQPQIPLFYSLPLASQQLSHKIWLLVIPLLSLAITMLHTLFIFSFRKIDQFLLRLFTWSTTIILALLLLALIRIIFVTT